MNAWVKSAADPGISNFSTFGGRQNRIYPMASDAKNAGEHDIEKGSNSQPEGAVEV